MPNRSDCRGRTIDGLVMYATIAQRPAIRQLSITDDYGSSGVVCGIDDYRQMQHTIAGKRGLGVKSCGIGGVERILILLRKGYIHDQLSVICSSPLVVGVVLAERDRCKGLVVGAVLNDG